MQLDNKDIISEKNINFVKAHGCGNDFVILNNFNGELNEYAHNYSLLAQNLCRQNYSIGADGLVIFDKSDSADYYMHIYDSDGTKEDMCGNAARCTALYASSIGLGNKFEFETGAGFLEAHVNEDSVKIKMTPPKDYTSNIKIKIDDTTEILCHYINTGVPHIVIFNEDNGITPSVKLGRKIRNHEFSIKMGDACVNFVDGIKQNRICVHTYETGIENITNACGTGCTAVAVVLGLIKGFDSPVKLYTPGNDFLTISFTRTKNFVKKVYKEGPAVLLCKGNLYIKK
jgi:diaminopimelate epimerase